MNYITSIIEWFKRIFNINPKRKTAEEFETDFDDYTNISITNAISQRLTSLTLSDSSVNILGDSQRAIYLNDFAQKFFDTRMGAVSQICMGTGDCIAKPNTDGVRFGVDIVSNDNFRIVESVGDFIYSILIKCDEKITSSAKYERFEFHRLNNDNGINYVSITQVIFKNGNQVEVKEVPEWAELTETRIIPNVDRLLFGRFKCPTLNRVDVNSPNGVPITFGAEEIIEQIKVSWRRFNQEFADTEPMIFAEKSLFKETSKNGKKVISLPKGKERVIQAVGATANVDGEKRIQEFAPTIRDGSLDNAIERNFRMLELFCGLSEGILTKSTLTYTNTDEVRKSTQATFATICELRKVLENGFTDLIYAINALCNANEITPIGDYSINIDWSDDFVQSMSERFNELMQGNTAGVVSNAEFRSWIMSEDVEQAKEQLLKIEDE